jgi:hypothetical protein
MGGKKSVSPFLACEWKRRTNGGADLCALARTWRRRSEDAATPRRYDVRHHGIRAYALRPHHHARGAWTTVCFGNECELGKIDAHK